MNGNACQPGLFDYPAHAAVGRAIPKSRIFTASKPNRRLRDKITQHVAQIVWQYKLAPETLHLQATDAVAEIQVFRIALKPAGVLEKLPDDILRCIDRAIGVPLIFELATSVDDGATRTQTRVAATYKRPSESDTTKWVTGDYFATEWLPADTSRTPLPMATNMGQLYEQMLRQLIPLTARDGESMQALVERQRQAAIKQRECQRLEKRLSREKQFNRKVEVNRELRSSQAELALLTQAKINHTSADYTD